MTNDIKIGTREYVDVFYYSKNEFITQGSLHSKQTMGVRYLASKLRESGITPDKLAEGELLNGKTIGIDLLVILHKALCTNDGAGEYY